MTDVRDLWLFRYFFTFEMIQALSPPSHFFRSSGVILERGQGSGKELLKRLEIYVRFPVAALYELKRNRASLHSEVYQRVTAEIEAKALPKR